MIWPPNYAGELARRMEIERTVAQHPELIKGARELYASSPVLFISDCVWLYEPRAANRGEPTRLPAVPFKRQIEFIEWMWDRVQTQTSAPVEKSRDSGATWIASAFAVWLWLFHPGSTVGFGSRKEILVDRNGDLNSIFEKIRSIIKYLPPWLLPQGWNPKFHSNYMRIINPENDASIVGEAGDNIGRGGRATLYVVDEAQPLTANVLTPTGWRLMGELSVGDRVLGPEGDEREIVGINDCGEHLVYRVTFSDGTTAECTENHLWTVDRVIGKRQRETKRTRELLTDYVYHSPGGQTQYRYRLPLCRPMEFSGLPSEPPPLDPYLCGALLGDGSYAHGTVRLTTADDEMVEAFRHLLPADVARVGKHDGRYTYNLISAGEGRGRAKGGGYKSNQVRNLLEASGLVRATGPHKRVPDAYKWGSAACRLAVLQGLMDTDGYCNKVSGGASFHTSSPQLADDVVFIVQSLGGLCWRSVKSDARGYRDQHCVQVSMPHGVVPFRLGRKAAAYALRRNTALSRAIVSIEPTTRQTVRCISLEADDGLYVTDSFVVTHNSAFLERPQLVDAALSATTDCRIDISSPRAGTIFNAWCAANAHKFIFDVSDAPWHTAEWLKQKQTDAESKGLGHLFRQEFLRDSTAGIEGQLIKSDWVEAAIDAHVKLGIKPTGVKRVGLDVADGGMDRSAFAKRHGIVVLDVKSRGDLLADAAGMWAYAEAEMFEATEFLYDSIGVGAGAAAALRDKRKPPATGWSASGAVLDPTRKYEGNRTQEDMFSNAKSQAWWFVRDRFIKTYRAVREGRQYDPDELISLSSEITELRELKTELSQVVYKHNPSGKVLIDKAPDGHPSPNRADSVIIAMAPKPQGIRVLGTF